jgi:hypothetical protein
VEANDHGLVEASDHGLRKLQSHTFCCIFEFNFDNIVNEMIDEEEGISPSRFIA